jgi:hypothetical protein
MRRNDKKIAMKKANLAFEERINEGFEGFEKSVEETPTMMKLIKTAEKDGHISGMETSAQYITSAAKEVAAKWDALNPEEKKVYRTTYYQLFLKKIGKVKDIDLNF